MTLKASLGCTTKDWLCHIGENLEEVHTHPLNNEQFYAGMVLAEAVMAASRIKLVDAILNTTSLNHLKVIDDNEMLIRIAEYNEGILSNNLALLAYIYPLEFNDCYTSNQVNRLSYYAT